MSMRRDKPTSLCTTDPARTVTAIADALGRDSRRELVELVVDAWVDVVPDGELAANYEKALAGLGPEDLRDVAGWAGSRGSTLAVANVRFLVGAFSALGDGRRDALRLAARLRGSCAFDAGLSELQVLATVLPCLPAERLHALARDASDLYLTDRLGSDN